MENLTFYKILNSLDQSIKFKSQPIILNPTSNPSSLELKLDITSICKKIYSSEEYRREIENKPDVFPILIYSQLLQNLNVLCISDYPCKTLPDFPNLTHLLCYNTKLEILPNLPKIERLDSERNHFKFIPETWLNLKDLNCKYSSIDHNRGIPPNLIKITHLSFMYSTDNSDFLKIPETLINIELLRITCTKAKIPSFLPALNYLEVAESPNFDEISPMLTNLIGLVCTNTNVSIIPDTLVKLERLYIGNTRVREISRTLINLQELYCSNTGIRSVPKELTKLKKIKR